MQLSIFEDAKYRNFLPLVFFRPVFCLLSGATELRTKIERHFRTTSISYCCRPELTDIMREHHPSARVNELHKDETWFVNGRVLADDLFGRMLKSSPRHDIAFFAGNELVAARVSAEGVAPIMEQRIDGLIAPGQFAHLPQRNVDATLMQYPWDLVEANGDVVREDFRLSAKRLKKRIRGTIYPGVHLLGKKNIVIGEGSVVKSGSVLDAESGPIIVGKNVSIHSNVVLEGPVYVGDGSIIKAGTRIHPNSSIGSACKMGGEIENSIILPYTNKQHDGYLGHSYIGSWVNIGADTNNSDLKNNYSSVRITINGVSVDSGKLFVGLFMGDHTKTGINVMFDTGTVVGVSCNIFGAGLPPKSVPSFSWGSVSSVFSIYKLEKSIETAQRVMARRNVPWTSAYENLFRHVFEATVAERARARIF